MPSLRIYYTIGPYFNYSPISISRFNDWAKGGPPGHGWPGTINQLAAHNAARERQYFMSFTVAGIIVLGLLGYLAYALFHPERFK